MKGEITVSKDVDYFPVKGAIIVIKDVENPPEARRLSSSRTRKFSVKGRSTVVEDEKIPGRLGRSNI